MRRTQYYTDLHRNAELKLCWFAPLLRLAAKSGKAVRARPTTEQPVRASGYDYTLTFTKIELTPDPDPDAWLYYLLLEWEDEGEAYRQRITIQAEESNLIKGSEVYYFLCASGNKSRTLFYIGNVWKDRRSFRHRYGYQTRSRQQRELNLFHQTHGEQPPYKRNGKEYYRGKLTPYGKRLQRWYEKEERGFKALQNFVGGLRNKFK